MTGVDCVAIVGLGLIGGSIAHDLTAAGVRVLGYDTDPAQLAAALSSGGIAGALDASLAGVAEADVVVLAVPVDAAPAVLAAARPHLARARVVTDAGSTKRGIVAAAEALGVGARFVGAHPIAGDHRSGWAAARRGLFVDARTYLCPTRDTTRDALAKAQALWQALGARPEVIDAAAHDERLAWASHLPQTAATALALALAAAGVHRDALGPGGRDATRLAGSAPDMWTAIALDNADALAGALGALEAQLGALRRAVAERDAHAVHERFAAGRRWFDAG